eukprot:scaffold633_cov288-Ochromonas_danica.AAC.64
MAARPERCRSKRNSSTKSKLRPNLLSPSPCDTYSQLETAASRTSPRYQLHRHLPASPPPPPAAAVDKSPRGTISTTDCYYYHQTSAACCYGVSFCSHRYDHLRSCAAR